MIGVIGANGVAATNKLCQLIEEQGVKSGAFRDCHHPEMIIWQATQAPSRSMYLEGRGESFIPDYTRIGLKLKECGCDELCMCCNTAHYYINELQEAIGLPIFNLIAGVGKKVKNLGLRKVGLMCSDGLAKVKFYDKIFAEVCPNAEIIYPSPEYQKLVTRGICNAKNTQRYTDISNHENPAHCFTEVVKYFKARGVDGIIAGCTDINNVFPVPTEILGDIAYIDSLEVLAGHIASRNPYLPGK